MLSIDGTVAGWNSTTRRITRAQVPDIRRPPRARPHGQCAGAQQPSKDSAPVAPPPATLTELESRIRRLLDSTKTPGAALAIVRHDSVIYTGGFGLARVEPSLPANARTLFRIGSTSKAFVALVAMQLQREGKLTINDPIRKHLPDFWYRNDWETTDPLRIVHFLEHTSGFDDNSLRTYASSDPAPLTLEQGLALDSTTRVSRWRPGTRFSYCNTGPAIVALIIERIEKKPFEQVVQERFFTPIGMRSATYLYPDTSVVEMAQLYRDDGRTTYPYWHVFIRPAGSINASATDMAEYLRFLLGRGTINGTTLLPAEDIARMERAETWIGTRAGLTMGYGLHLYRLTDSTGFVWTGHNGGVEGGLSDLSYIPESGVGYATQINTANGSVQGELAALVRGFLTKDLQRLPEPPVGTLAPAVSGEFSGWYRPVSPRMQHLWFAERIGGLAALRFSDDRLHYKPLLGDETELIPVDSMRFRGRGEPVATVALLRDPENDRPQAAEVDQTSMQRVGSLQAWTEIALGGGWLAALVAGFVALALVPIRALIRRVRKRPAKPASEARPLWRSAMIASVLMLIPVIAITVGGAGIAELGNLSMVSGAMYAAGIAYLLWALFGLVRVLRTRGTAAGWQAVSLWTVRSALVLHAVGACYMTWFGVIGWRTWA